jgi:hypothetical protein
MNNLTTLEHGGVTWEVAVAGPHHDFYPPGILIRRSTDVDDFTLDYWKPVLQPEFVDEVEAASLRLQSLPDDQRVEDLATVSA